jgi:adenine phosphoribosyltransferase
MTQDIRRWIRDIPDFPEKGVLFRDITPALLDPIPFRYICDQLVERYAESDIDKIAGIEARGFFFASVLAYRLDKGMIPLRKPGKLPWKTISRSYSLEYGEATVEMHEDAVEEGEKILLVDDLLATGGTAAAAAGLIESRGGIIEEIAFVIELSELGGRDQLGDRKTFSLVTF